MTRTSDETLRAVLAPARVVPVLTVEAPEAAAALAQALVRGGVRVLEVTLRTEGAVAAARAMMEAVPDAVLGVGTVTRPEDFATAKALGARFAVSPGFTSALAAAAREAGLPWLPGIATVSEALAAREAGFQTLKFFPAEQSGGLAALRAIRPVLPELRFCPTGGVTERNCTEYLELDTVICVGGSWLAPPRLVEERDWSGITAIARRTLDRIAGTLSV